MTVHNASTSDSLHECQIETVLISCEGGGPAGSGIRSTAVGVIVSVVVSVLERNTVGVTVMETMAVGAVGVAWEVVWGVGVFAFTV